VTSQSVLLVENVLTESVSKLGITYAQISTSIVDLSELTDDLEMLGHVTVSRVFLEESECVNDSLVGT
jgi:hypothetical protein